MSGYPSVFRQLFLEKTVKMTVEWLKLHNYFVYGSA
jgi:hypothetical protein